MRSDLNGWLHARIWLDACSIIPWSNARVSNRIDSGFPRQQRGIDSSCSFTCNISTRNPAFSGCWNYRFYWGSPYIPELYSICFDWCSRCRYRSCVTTRAQNATVWKCSKGSRLFSKRESTGSIFIITINHRCKDCIWS